MLTFRKLNGEENGHFSLSQLI